MTGEAVDQAHRWQVVMSTNTGTNDYPVQVQAFTGNVWSESTIDIRVNITDFDVAKSRRVKHLALAMILIPFEKFHQNTEIIKDFAKRRDPLPREVGSQGSPSAQTDDSLMAVMKILRQAETDGLCFNQRACRTVVVSRSPDSTPKKTVVAKMARSLGLKGGFSGAEASANVSKGTEEQVTVVKTQDSTLLILGKSIVCFSERIKPQWRHNQLSLNPTMELNLALESGPVSDKYLVYIDVAIKRYDKSVLHRWTRKLLKHSYQFHNGVRPSFDPKDRYQPESYQPALIHMPESPDSTT